MKKILILGSTGSIGTSALELIRNNREEYQVVAISGNRNIELLKKQIEEFKPLAIYVGAEEEAIKIENEYSFSIFIASSSAPTYIAKGLNSSICFLSNSIFLLPLIATT